MASQDSGIETGNDSNDSSYHASQESKDASQIKYKVATLAKIASQDNSEMFLLPAGNDISDRDSRREQDSYHASQESKDASQIKYKVATLAKISQENSEMFLLPATPRFNHFGLARGLLPPPAEPPAGLFFRNLQPSSLGLGNGYELVVGPGLRKMRACHCRCSRRRTPRDTWMQFKIPLDERKLRTAVSVNNIELVESLLASGVNPNNSDVHKRSPLHLASCRGYSTIVRMLLEKGANPNLKDSLGNTPLHIAACTNNVEVVTLLIRAGADVSSGDNSGRNPLQIAQSKLRLLQRAKSEDAVHVKAEVAQVVEMMKTFLQKRGQDMEAELLSAFSSRLSLSDTPAKVETDVRDLLASLSGLSLNQ